MKVLHFTTTVGRGGAEMMLANLVEAHDRLGIENVVVSTTGRARDLTNLKRMQAHARFHDLGVKSLLSPRCVRGLWRILREEKPDVLQTWMHTSGLVAGMVARFAGVSRVVWGIHSRELLCGHRKPCWKCFSIARCLGLASRFIPDEIVSCSRVGAQEHHRRMGYPLSRLRWIGNGVDVEKRFRPIPDQREEWRKEHGIPEDAFVVGIVTRMHPVKDIPTLLRAASLFQQRRRSAHVVIAGGVLEEADEMTRRDAAAVFDPGRLHWAGYQPQVERVYAGLDVATLTSVTEAYPMVLIEAMACGVPCVSTDVGDAAAILGDTGRVVPVRDPEALCAGWESMMDLEVAAFQELCKAARVRAVENFSLAKCAQEYLDVYRGSGLRPGGRSLDAEAHEAPVGVAHLS